MTIAARKKSAKPRQGENATDNCVNCCRFVKIIEKGKSEKMAP